MRLNSILWVATVAVVPNLTSCASIAPAPGPLVGEVEIAPSQDVKLEAVERPIARVLWSAPARQAIVVAGRPSNKYPDLGGLLGTSPDGVIAWVEVLRNQAPSLDLFEVDVSTGKGKTVWSADPADYGARPFGSPSDSLVTDSPSEDRYWAIRSKLALARRRDQKAHIHPSNPNLALASGTRGGVFLVDRSKERMFQLDQDMDAGHSPSFSPDGAWIAWVGLAPNDWNGQKPLYRTYVRATDGQAVHRTGLRHPKSLLWASDGNYIYALTVTPRICVERVRRGQWDRAETLTCLSEQTGRRANMMVVAGDSTSVVAGSQTDRPLEHRTLSIVWVSTVTGESLAARELPNCARVAALRSDGLAIVAMEDDGFGIANLGTGEVHDAPMLDGASWRSLSDAVWRTDRPLLFVRSAETNVELVAFDVDAFLAR